MNLSPVITLCLPRPCAVLLQFAALPIPAEALPATGPAALLSAAANAAAFNGAGAPYGCCCLGLTGPMGVHAVLKPHDHLDCCISLHVIGGCSARNDCHTAELA
jgi:hypothetical protein